MTTIEIHGVGLHDISLLKRKIADALHGASYERDIVVTDMKNEVNDLQGNSRPFLRVITNEADDLGILRKIEVRFRSLGIDIQEQLLERFRPAILQAK
jgi:hypothetical protein